MYNVFIKFRKTFINVCLKYILIFRKTFMNIYICEYLTEFEVYVYLIIYFNYV